MLNKKPASESHQMLPSFIREYEHRQIVKIFYTATGFFKLVIKGFETDVMRG